MAQERPGTGGKSALEGDALRAETRIRQEASAAKGAVREGKQAVLDAADTVTEAVKEEAAARGDGLKDQTAEGLHAFAEAVRAASEELSSRQPGTVSDLVGQAASGLEGLSRSLQQRSVGDLLDEVRSFGRKNPAAYIAGSILAGFALGRFAGSSAPRKTRTNPDLRRGGEES